VPALSLVLMHVVDGMVRSTVSGVGSERRA
jgi:hypothetical protein